jgi:serine/threonine protein kinase
MKQTPYLFMQMFTQTTPVAASCRCVRGVADMLLDKMGYVKITDFGFAKRITAKTHSLRGTPEYLAPEVILQTGHDSCVDWWTMGILIYEMIVGQPPFVDDNPMGVYQKIMNGKVEFPRTIDKHTKSIIKKLLVADTTKRLGHVGAGGGATEIKKHKFFREFDFAALMAKTIEAPVVPSVKDDTDTSNFDLYPDSVEEAALPSFEGGADPFEGI